MTSLGKALVLATVFFSLVFLAIAANIFLNSPNWGWDSKHARKEFGTPIPSEIDKRKPLISELAQARYRALEGWKEASKRLAKLEIEIPQYQLQYADEQARLRTGDPMDQKALAKLKPWLFEKDPKTGKPLFDFGEVDNTFNGYTKVLNGLLANTKKKRDEVDAVIKEEQALTEELNGKVDATGKQEKGLYALIALEDDVRRRALEEIEDIRPGYFEALIYSQDLLKRQRALKARIAELKSAAGD
jgi:hypothetical protein